MYKVIKMKAGDSEVRAPACRWAAGPRGRSAGPAGGRPAVLGAAERQAARLPAAPPNTPGGTRDHFAHYLTNTQSMDTSRSFNELYISLLSNERV